MTDVAHRIIEDLETLSVTIEYYSKGRARYNYQDAVSDVVQFIKNDVWGKTTNLDVSGVVGTYVEDKMKSVPDNDFAMRAYQDMMVVLSHHQLIVERVLYV